MKTYYIEYLDGSGRAQFFADSDAAAIAKVSKFQSKILLYRESDTPDGTPFKELRNDKV